jgi:sugar transferase (PEP-CTERM/EpsH1 system associated)
MPLTSPLVPDRTERPRAGRATPVRVMHLVYRLASGGMEHNIIKLANAHDPSRVVAGICSCQPADPLKERLDPSVRLFELSRRHGHDFRIVAQLARLFGRERPDVLHTHGWGALCEGVVAARLARVPFIVHGEHGTMETRPRNLRIQRFLWSRVQRVLSVSSRLAERMSAEVGFDRRNITVIRNGVDMRRIAAGNASAIRDELGLKASDLVIGTVGRLEPVKDHDTLLDALALVRNAGLPFKAIIAGDGSLRDALDRRAAELGLQGAVLFLGERSDVENVLAASDIFVMSSRSEGLSNTIIEAMAAGLPVVSTAVGGADELIADGVTGRLVPPANPAALAQSLAHLLRNPTEREAMGRRAHQRAASDFDLHRMVRDYEDLYLEVCGSKGPAKPQSR